MVKNIVYKPKRKYHETQIIIFSHPADGNGH